jgi:hypothetical protein
LWFNDKKERINTWRAVMKAVIPAKPRGRAMAEQSAALAHMKGKKKGASGK